MRENLFLRTDVLPEEIPILFSNRNVYSNFSKSFIEKMIKLEQEANKKENRLMSLITVPYSFYIPKKNRSRRKMALLHPLAQLQAFTYILRYDQLISNLGKKSVYSVRTPVIRNQPVYNFKNAELTWKRMDQEFSFSKDTSVTTEEDDIYFHSYFSYKRYKRIHELYDSNKFNRNKYRYQYFMKFDIQNFFSSIYTHALAWSIFGDKSLAKRLKNIDEAFGNATDKIAQTINFNETNGIVVGPEFSRVLAEMLLTRIDLNIKDTLNKKSLIHNKDYIIYRYVDDYFLFVHNKENAYLIENVVELELDKYNLKLNTSKTIIQERPFEIVDQSIVELKNAISLFNYNISRYTKVESNNYGWLKSIWRDLFNNLELLVSKYPESNSRIINYFLKNARSLLPEPQKANKFNIIYSLEIVSNIYSLGISPNSTHYLIAVFLKVIQKYKSFIDGLDPEENQKDIVMHKGNLEYIEEKTYQLLYSLLRNNPDKIPYSYDLIIYLKTLNKKLSSSFLSQVIEEHKNSYFVICSIAYYILNENKNGVLNMYKTVHAKLRDAVFSTLKNYQTKGAQNFLLESEYFYYINDFSYYPGFSPKDRKKLSNIIKKHRNDFFFEQSVSNNVQLSNLRDMQKDIFDKITKFSYYQWDKTTENFLRDIAKKSVNKKKNKIETDY